MANSSDSIVSFVNSVASLCGNTAIALSELSLSIQACRPSLSSTASECITTQAVLDTLESVLDSLSKSTTSQSSQPKELQDCFEVLVQAINSNIQDINIEAKRLERYTLTGDPPASSEPVSIPQDAVLEVRSNLRRNRASISLILDCFQSGKLVEATVNLNHSSNATASEKLAALKLQPHVAITISKQSSKPQNVQLMARLRPKASRSYKTDSKIVKKLHEGIERGDYGAVYKCLCDRADPNALLKASKTTPIHRALTQAEAALGCEDDVASRDLLSIVTILILAGANMTAVDDFRQTPLIRAVKGEMGDSLVALMLECGARVNATDNEQNTALHYAAMRRASAEMRNVEVIRTLLVYGADQSVKNLRGRTPLYKAVMYEDVGRTTELMNYGGDLEMSDNNLWTVLYAAVLQGNIALTRLLCERGAFVDKKDKTGQTALHYAVSQGRQEIVEVLVSHGADVNLISKGETPLCRATSKSNAALISALLKYGADVSVPSPGYNGALPIHIAAIGKDAGILNMLLDAGSPANAVDDAGRTPCAWAMDVHKKEFVKILTSRGGS